MSKRNQLRKYIKRRAVEDFGIPPERETGIVFSTPGGEGTGTMPDPSAA